MGKEWNFMFKKQSWVHPPMSVTFSGIQSSAGQIQWSKNDVILRWCHFSDSTNCSSYYIGKPSKCHFCLDNSEQNVPLPAWNWSSHKVRLRAVLDGICFLRCLNLLDFVSIFSRVKKVVVLCQLLTATTSHVYCLVCYQFQKDVHSFSIFSVISITGHYS